MPFSLQFQTGIFLFQTPVFILSSCLRIGRGIQIVRDARVFRQVDIRIGLELCNLICPIRLPPPTQLEQYPDGPAKPHWDFWVNYLKKFKEQDREVFRFFSKNSLFSKKFENFFGKKCHFAALDCL